MPSMDYTIMSWNINGFKAAVKHGFFSVIKKYKPDILGVQEIKHDTTPLLPGELSDYAVIWYPAKKKGYAGTALLTKKKPSSVVKGIGEKAFDDEGRVITAEYEHFYLLNIYFPNAQHTLDRLDFKLKFDDALLKWVEKLRRQKPIVMMGDFNVAHEPIDIARPKQNEGNAGYTKEERDWFSKLLTHGYVDTFRYKHGDTVKYSWWSYRFNARARNIGWRVDYIVVSEELKRHVVESDILTDVKGSDHAPLIAKLHF